MLDYGAVSEQISKDIREAFRLLDEINPKYRRDVDLNGSYIVTSYSSGFLDVTNILGFGVLYCDLQSSYDYFIAIPDSNESENKFLKCHREAMGVYRE